MGSKALGTTEETVSAELMGQEHDSGAGEPQAEIPHSLENSGGWGNGIAPKAAGLRRESRTGRPMVRWRGGG